MKKTLLIGNYGARNKGDELILRGLLNICKDLKLDPCIVSHNPKETNSIYGLPSVSRLPVGLRSFLRFRWIKTLREYWRSDYVILGGGGLFVDRFKRAVVLWGFHGLMAILFRKPLLLVGHSFEIRRFCARRILRFLCKRAKIIIVRDKMSLEFLNKIEIPGEKCFLYPDIGFNGFHNMEIRKEMILGIALCKWGLSSAGINEILGFIEYVLNDGIREVFLFPFQVGNDNDLLVLKRIKGLLNDKRVKIIEYDDPEFFSNFQKCAHILGMRLHSILLAFASRIPFTAIAYQNKVLHSVEDLGLKKYCVPVNSFTCRNLCDCFELAQSDKTYFERYSRYQAEMKSLIESIEVLL